MVLERRHARGRSASHNRRGPFAPRRCGTPRRGVPRGGRPGLDASKRLLIILNFKILEASRRLCLKIISVILLGDCPCIAAIKAELTNLRVGEFRAHVGQYYLALARVRMRGSKNPSSPLDHVLHDGLGFQQVVACVEMKMGRVDTASDRADSSAGLRGCSRGCAGTRLGFD